MTDLATVTDAELEVELARLEEQVLELELELDELEERAAKLRVFQELRAEVVRLGQELAEARAQAVE